MVFYENKEKQTFHYFKVIVVLFLIGLTAGFLSCTSPTASTTSSGSGTGVGWTVTISAFPTSVSASNGVASSVVVQARDSSGSPAIKGTNVCVTASRGSFLHTGSTPTNPLLDTTHCETTTNDIGQLQVTYVPLILEKINGVVYAVAIASGSDVISASAMGAIGYTTIQVLD